MIPATSKLVTSPYDHDYQLSTRNLVIRKDYAKYFANNFLKFQKTKNDVIAQKTLTIIRFACLKACSKMSQYSIYILLIFLKLDISHSSKIELASTPLNACFLNCFVQSIFS